MDFGGKCHQQDKNKIHYVYILFPLFELERLHVQHPSEVIGELEVCVHYFIKTSQEKKMSQIIRDYGYMVYLKYSV